MSSARDHDDWKRARFGARRESRETREALPAGGLAETVYCGLHARTGSWPPDFLEIVRRVWNGQIPRRFHARSAAIRAELERACALEEAEGPRPAPPVRVFVGGELVGHLDPVTLEPL